MIRGVIGLFVFAVALCAYIVTAPSRAMPPPLQPVVSAEVTRAQTASFVTDPILETTEAVPVQVAAAPAPLPPVSAARIRTDDQTILATTSSVLAGLGLDSPASSASTLDQQDARRTTRDTALETLVITALREGRPDAEIDRLLNDAAIAGQLTVPEVLVTSDGRVDTHVLLASIVTQAKIASGGPAPVVPDVPTGDGTGVEVRVVQRATETEQYRFYTVHRGDSLGAIAIKFYGDVSKYPVIFDANRGILSSPDMIRVGQRLTIPDLPEI